MAATMLSHYDCIMNNALKPVTQSQLRLAVEASGNALDACTAQWYDGHGSAAASGMALFCRGGKLLNDTLEHAEAGRISG